MPTRALLLALFLPLAAAAQELALQRVTGGLSAPLGIVSAGDSRLFIVQQRGTVSIWDGTRVLPTPFLDVRTLVSCCNERGLLGLAFHPHYAANGLFFIYYTGTSGDVTVARYKLLRIDVDRPPYAVPAGNPFASRPNVRGEIWAYGLRNPWRFSFDRETGDLWIADVGQNLYEEVDLQPAVSAGSENYGWRLMEATHCFNPATNCPTVGLVMPILEYSHTLGCSITGGYRYRGARFPRTTRNSNT